MEKTGFSQKKIVEFIAIGLVAIAALGSVPAQAQIPVTDTAAITKSWEGHLAELAKWVDQLKAMEQQYVQMKAQYDAITGPRGMQNLMNNATHQVLPDDFTQSYNKLLTMGQGGASNGAKKIYDVIKKLDCSRFGDADTKLSCEAQAYAEPENASYIDNALAAAQERAAQLQQLLGQIDGATDLKAAADLSNRIAAEQSLLQNEQTLVNLALAQRESQSMLLAQARREEGKKAILTNTANPVGGFK
ncbi:type IV secretion system protein [Pollutimonas bauzanensis]|uniref:Type IV secretion system protein VirB5 n=1 Tax=Pollutimonas bauzanensis TaxID=658167 RepID=A0A1M5XMQ3_9BURK|nr:type IV secretion system protein [Pollutimonas bauzanensis]SHI00828.1 type IV secretion system protein VirB5 [Pollutimonas bauzanensis]